MNLVLTPRFHLIRINPEITMALNPFREALGQAGLRAFHHDSTFKADADAALAQYQALHDDLERQVRRGDLTLKVAREKAAASAAQLRATLHERAGGYSPVPRVFLDRLIETSNARKWAREHLSMEGLQRETNLLLRQGLVEQQLQNRAVEFEGKTFVRSMAGGLPAPTLDRLLAFHETASLAGDETAREWARRQLEGFRTRVTAPEDQHLIDLACDRPELVNPRLVSRYMEVLHEGDARSLEAFVTQALDGHDANACVAAFLLARRSPEGTRPRWVRQVLDGLKDFPDAALSTLRPLEAEARGEDAQAARAQADYAIALAEAQVNFPSLESPSEAELERQARVQAKPLAQWDEPIGLALDRRGATPEEYAALLKPNPET
jgi:hypothetical protein